VPAPSTNECGTSVAGRCPVFDRLCGSRMAVGNAELRVPLLGPLGIVPSRSVPAVETALFYDAGIAWTSAKQAELRGVARQPVTSYGASLRFNILGFAVGQLSYVHPNDRPLKSWHWKFSLLPRLLNKGATEEPKEDLAEQWPVAGSEQHG
jgi:surface antigen Omp85-like protein